MLRFGLPGWNPYTENNVWSFYGSRDGLHVWNKEGTLLGKMVVRGGSNNFMFLPGAILVFNAQKLWYVGIKAQGRSGGRPL